MPKLIHKADLEKLKELMGDQYKKLVETYLRSSDKHVANIQKGVQERDAQLVKDSAHAMKSSSSSLSLYLFASKVEALEAMARKVVNDEAAFEHLLAPIDEIVDLYKQSKRALLDAS